jgi:proliferating cell nuclear antigen
MVHILEVQTEHVVPFKILIEVLKDILADVCIEFIQDDQINTSDNAERINGGIKIVTVDPTKSVLINLKLDAKQFYKFICKQPKIELGINLTVFYKLIKNIEKDDTLTFYVDDEDRQYLSIQIDNHEKKCISLYRLKLMDLDYQPLHIPPTVFDAVITMSSSDFHKVCKEMHQISEYIEIKCLAKYIKFTCRGDSCDGSKTFMIDDNGIHIRHCGNPINNCIIQGVYELKNLTLFTKCTNLCNDIQIFMKNDYPLVIKYTIATLGRILLCLTPISDPDNKNDSEDDS